MFKKGYTYGEILLYLFNNPGIRCDEDDIKENITLVSDDHFNDVIKWLLEDNLITTESYNKAHLPDVVTIDVYRISYHGFTFIKDLKEKRATRFTNSMAIIIACISIILSCIFNYRNNESIYKVEITKFPYRNNIKHDTAPPIAKPCTTPKAIAGQSSHVKGNP